MKFTPEDVSVSWMPLTHDMGLIGFHIFMFGNHLQQYLMPTDLFVRRPLLGHDICRGRKQVTISKPTTLGVLAYSKVSGDRSTYGLDRESVQHRYSTAPSPYRWRCARSS